MVNVKFFGNFPIINVLKVLNCFIAVSANYKITCAFLSALSKGLPNSSIIGIVPIAPLETNSNTATHFLYLHHCASQIADFIV